MLNIKDECDIIVKDVLRYTAEVLRNLIVSEKTDEENEVLSILSKQCDAVVGMLDRLKYVEGEYEYRKRFNPNMRFYRSKFRVFPNRNKKN